MYGRMATKLLSVSCCIAVPAAYTFCQPTADTDVADSNKTLDTSSYLDTFLQQEIASILFSSGAAAPPPSIVAPVPFYATPSIQRALHFLTTHSSSHLFVRGNDHTGKTSLLTYLQQSFLANNDLVIELDGTSPAASLSTYLCENSTLLRLVRTISPLLPVDVTDDLLLQHTVAAVQDETRKRKTKQLLPTQTTDHRQIYLFVDNDINLHRTVAWMQAFESSSTTTKEEAATTTATTATTAKTKHEQDQDAYFRSRGWESERESEWESVRESEWESDSLDAQCPPQPKRNSLVQIISASKYTYCHRTISSETPRPPHPSNPSNPTEHQVEVEMLNTDASGMYGILHLPNVMTLLPTDDEDDEDDELTNTTTMFPGINVPALTSLRMYLNEYLNERQTDTSDIRKEIDREDMRDIVQTIGNTYASFTEFLKCYTAGTVTGDGGDGDDDVVMSTTALCTAICTSMLNAVPLSSTLFPADDDATSRCSYRILCRLACDDVLGASGGGGGGSNSVVGAMGNGTLEEKEGAPSRRWLLGKDLLALYEHQTVPFLHAVADVHWLRLRLPAKSLNHVWYPTTEDMTATPMQSASIVSEAFQYVSVDECLFEVDTLWSNSFLHYISKVERHERPEQHERTISRLEALLQLRYMEEDTMEMVAEEQLLDEEQRLTQQAWDRALQLEQEGSISDQELLTLQLKLDQRKGSERTRRFEIDKRKRRIDAIVFGATNVVNKYKFDRKYTDEGT